MRLFPSVRITTFLLVAGSAYLASAKNQMPTSEDIVRAVKAVKLNPRASTTAEKDGMKVTLTPIDFSTIKKPNLLEKGQIIAVVDVRGTPELPNGKYNVYVVKSNDGWRAFFASGSKIVEQCTHVDVTTGSGERQPGIQIHTKLCFCGDMCTSGHSPNYCWHFCHRCE